ncbi:MAG TPA: diguanylate cyclase [Malonomonas sp.]
MLHYLFATVTKKVVVGYLVVVFFLLLAVGFALSRLHQQTARTEQLVNVDFRAFELGRDLQQNLLAQENIEKQLLIIRDPALKELRANRNAELVRFQHQLSKIPQNELSQILMAEISDYRQADLSLSEALARNDWQLAENVSAGKMVPIRLRLLEVLADLRQQQQLGINNDLSVLSAQSNEAYQLTLLFSLIGIALSAPVALTVVLSIHRSVNTLKKATQEISDGSFEHQPKLSGNDEFAQLAQGFSQMGRKLRELEQLRLDANPLTGLPGNLAIDREIDLRIERHNPFAHLYIDLDNFKVYSDRYGYNAGSDVLARVGQLIQQVVGEHGTDQDLVGHIGGDDYVVITEPAAAEPIAQKIIDIFSEQVPSFYSLEDREAGEVAGQDRYGVERTFPLMTISVAVIFSDHYEYPSRLLISQACARLKEYLKGQQGSNYMVGRQKS